MIVYALHPHFFAAFRKGAFVLTVSSAYTTTHYLCGLTGYTPSSSWTIDCFTMDREDE